MLLEALQQQPYSGEQVCQLRAVQVLEATGTPAAHEILEALTKGAPAAPQTREAQAALARLRARRQMVDVPVAPGGLTLPVEDR